jgi:Mn2+/Fe2+ NRAMP family transporter
MADALKLIIGGPAFLYVILFGAVSVVLQVFLKYSRYVSVLKWLTLSLFAYFGTVLFVHVPWGEVAQGLFIPKFSLDASFWTAVVAIFGTTISPYLFFWQSAQECEEVDQHDDEHPLIDQPREGPQAISRIRVDTIAGMLASNLVALAIMIATAATLHAHGVTTINSAAEAAQALKPIAGRFAFGLFSIGIIGTGLLAIPVLAGSAGYAVAEGMGWKTGLDNMPWQARGFYSVIGAATLLGLGIDWSPIDPIRALYWSAVLNGVIAVPMMAALMFVASSRRKMGEFRAGWVLGGLGWLSTAVMAAAALTMIYVSLK